MDALLLHSAGIMERLRYLTAAEAERLKAELATNRDRAIVGVMLHTGMRMGEATGLQVRDFDRESNTIRIERIVVKTGSVIDAKTGELRKLGFGGYSSYSKTKPINVVDDDGRVHQLRVQDLPAYLKGRNEFVKIGTKAHAQSGRTVPLSSEEDWKHILAELDGRERTAWAWRPGKGNADDALPGGRYSYTGCREMVIRAMRRAGIPNDKCHPHALRHTFAVHFLKNGGDLRTLQRIGGWSNITMVARYLEFVTEDLVEISKRVQLGF